MSRLMGLWKTGWHFVRLSVTVWIGMTVIIGSTVVGYSAYPWWEMPLFVIGSVLVVFGLRRLEQ